MSSSSTCHERARSRNRLRRTATSCARRHRRAGPSGFPAVRGGRCRRRGSPGSLPASAPTWSTPTTPRCSHPAGSRRAESGALLLYDSHELATGVPYHSRSWLALVSSVERLVVPRSDAVITVSDGIAEALQRKYGLERRPTVVRNLPDLPPPQEAGAVEDLRASLGIGPAPLVLHHGAAAEDRGGEALIRSFAELDGAHLLFLGADGGYADGLRRLSEQLGLGTRVHFRAPVPLADLLSYSAQADVGVTLLEDTCLNHRLALPNKAFEYIAAGIPVVASELPELRGLIDEYGVGWTADPADPASIAAALRSAFELRDDGALRDRLARAADRLSWRQEKSRLVGLYSGPPFNAR